MLKKFLLITLIITFSFCQLNTAAASKEWTQEEKLAKISKPAVVRIWAYYYATWAIGNHQILTAHGGFGSGAFINSEGYVVTNAHVVDVCSHADKQKWENLAWQLVYTLVENYQVNKEQAIALINQGYAHIGKIHMVNVVVTPGGEELPFELKEIGSPAGQKDSKDIAIIKVAGQNYPTIRLSGSDKTRTGERIFVAGYPSAGDLKAMGSVKSYLEWSWSPGSVSSDKKTTAQGTPLIQINAEGVTPGNSGGPVFNSDGHVIGLLTFYMNTKDGPNGPLYCLDAATIQEYIRKAGTSNNESLTNRSYRQGLELYWNGYYSKALSKFEETRRLYANHSEVDILIAECQQNIIEGNDKCYWPDYYGYFSLFALLFATALAIYYKRKKSAKIKLLNNCHDNNTGK
ncbi:serine protease Do [Sporomusaceae bacterium FL31]|nr:serine protease Do [Sporomusaceae bacterium FL31]GCE32428.1 serine protease Do [Sporomusaceae bacterium]